MSRLETGTKNSDIGNLCPGLGQAQRPLTLEIYVLAWDRHKDYLHWKSMSWLGTGTKTTDIGNLSNEIPFRSIADKESIIKNSQVYSENV